MKRRNKISKNAMFVIALIILVAGTFLYFQLYTTKGIPFVQHDGEWAISIFEGNPLSIKAVNNIKHPVLDAEKVTDMNAAFVADPFITKDNETYYMFFEVLKKNSHGDIAVANSSDGIVWNYQKTVLDENFHLSYPYVFSHNNEHYMIPQSSQTSSVRLYKAENYPYNWTYVKDIITGYNFTDSSLIFYNNVWYMFTTTNKSSNLRLYFSDSLNDNWTEHPQSPIYAYNLKYSRGAGRITEYKENLIRYAQDDESDYGRRIYAMNITVLNKTDFHEELLNISVVDASSINNWNKNGMHHISLVKVSEEQWLAAVDGKKNHLIFSWKN